MHLLSKSFTLWLLNIKEFKNMSGSCEYRYSTDSGNSWNLTLPFWVHTDLMLWARYCHARCLVWSSQLPWEEDFINEEIDICKISWSQSTWPQMVKITIPKLAPLNIAKISLHVLRLPCTVIQLQQKSKGKSCARWKI